MHPSEKIALFDMDGTLCDYYKGLFEALEQLRSPEEPPYTSSVTDDAPSHIKHRTDLIRSSELWWEHLPVFSLGWDILKVAKQLDYRIMILTRGTRKNTVSWSGKKKWIDGNLGPDVDITITRDKGLVYGRVLVDDYPPYVERWFHWRKRGLVIMGLSKKHFPNLFIV